MSHRRIPLSVLIIWILTSVAIALSLIALIGLLISRQDRIKKSFLKFLEEKFSVRIEDVDIKLFPLVELWDIRASGIRFESEDFKIGKVRIKNFSISLERISSDAINVHQVEVNLTKLRSLSVRLDGVHINITEGEGKKLDLSMLCKAKDKLSENVWKFLNMNLDFNSLSLSAGGFEIASDGNTKISSGKLSLRSTLIIVFRNERVAEGIFTFKGEIKTLGGEGAIEIYSPKVRSAFYLTSCQDSNLDLRVYLSVASSLREIVGVAIKFSDAASEVISESKLETHLSSISWVKFSLDYAGYAQLEWNSRINLGEMGSESIEIVGNYDSKMKTGNLRFSGSVDLSLIENLEGYLTFSGTSHLTGAQLSAGIKNFKYDIINVKKGEGTISFKDNVARFYLVMYAGEFPIRCNGEVDLKRKKVKADLTLFEVSAKKILEALSINDLPVEGKVSGKGNFLLKDNIGINADLKVRDADFLGEEISCVSLTIRTKVKFDGKFYLELEGLGMDEEGVCPFDGVNLDGLSFVSFKTEINEKGFKVDLKGVYDLQKFDMADLGIMGTSEFLGSVSGDLRGKIYGEIDVSSKELNFVDYPLRSSCVMGKVTFTKERLDFSGLTCEDFQISATHLFDSGKFFAHIWKEDVLVYVNEDSVYGEGRIDTVKSILPIYGDGFFKFAYSKNGRSGFVKVESNDFGFEGLKLENFNFTSDIKRDVMDFILKSNFKGNPIELDGIYNFKAKKVSAELSMKSFAGIPLEGKLGVSGDLKSPSIVGGITIANEVFSDRKIQSVISELQGLGKREVGSGGVGVFASATTVETGGFPLNIVIDLRNVVYDEPPLNLKFSGQIYVVGYSASPKVLGIFEIHDGTFLFAGMEFGKIRGNVFMRNADVVVNLSAQSFISTLERENYLINLNILGNIKAPNIYFSSVPSLSESDIICVIAALRKCKSVADFHEILGSIMYRNIEFLFSRIEQAMNLGERAIRPIIYPTGVGVAGEWGANEVEVVQSVIDEVVKFRLSRRLSDNVSIQMTWDNKKYGFSVLGNMGNLGIDIRTIRRF